MKYYYIISLLFLITHLAGAQYTVQTVPNQKRINNSYVSNPDHILSASAVADIDSLLASLEKNTTVQVAVVAVNAIEGGDEFTFSQDLFNAWGIGQKNNNGLLLLLVKDQHVVRLHTGSGLEGVLPDVICKRIEREYMVPEFKKNNYDGGVLSALKEINKILTEPKYAKELANQETETSGWTGFVVFMAIFCLPIIVIAYVLKAVHHEFADSKNSSYTPYPEMRLKRWAWLGEFAIAPAMIVALFGLSPMDDPSGLCFLALYIYFMGTTFHRIFRGQRVIKRLLEKKSYYDMVAFVRHDQWYWFWIMFLFPFPLVFYFFYHLARKRRYRNYPRKCEQCQGKMEKLSEKKEDEYLSKRQQLEESIHSIDYDVWKCVSCNAIATWNYPSKKTKYTACPSCSAVAYYMVSHQTLVHPSYTDSGYGEEVSKCLFCGKIKKSRFTLDRLVASSSSSSDSSSGSSFDSSSSSDSGSWGGGSSDGGGASSSW
jgi:uncharacterized protein